MKISKGNTRAILILKNITISKCCKWHIHNVAHYPLHSIELDFCVVDFCGGGVHGLSGPGSNPGHSGERQAPSLHHPCSATPLL